MIVCLCKGVSGRSIRAEIRNGCRSVRDVGQACGAGTGKGCRACVKQIREIIDEETAGLSPVTLKPAPSEMTPARVALPLLTS